MCTCVIELSLFSRCDRLVTSVKSDFFLFFFFLNTDFLKKSPGPPLEEEEVSLSSDSAETDDSHQSGVKKRSKLHVRIPKFSHKNNQNNQTVKTC